MVFFTNKEYADNLNCSGIVTETFLLLVLNIWLQSLIAVIPMLACLAESIGELEKRVDFRAEQVVWGERILCAVVD